MRSIRWDTESACLPCSRTPHTSPPSINETPSTHLPPHTCHQSTEMGRLLGTRRCWGTDSRSPRTGCSSSAQGSLRVINTFSATLRADVLSRHAQQEVLHAHAVGTYTHNASTPHIQHGFGKRAYGLVLALVLVHLLHAQSAIATVTTTLHELGGARVSSRTLQWRAHATIVVTPVRRARWTRVDRAAL